jgi:hypothetical protein
VRALRVIRLKCASPLLFPPTRFRSPATAVAEEPPSPKRRPGHRRRRGATIAEEAPRPPPSPKRRPTIAIPEEAPHAPRPDPSSQYPGAAPASGSPSPPPAFLPGNHHPLPSPPLSLRKICSDLPGSPREFGSLYAEFGSCRADCPRS